MPTDSQLLRCCVPQCTQHATNPENHATGHATDAQQPSLNALALLAIERNNMRNNHLTAPPITAQQSTHLADPFVAQFSDGIGTKRDNRGRALVPLVRCGDCTKFTRDPNNPQAGIGTCKDGEPDHSGRAYFPLVERVCGTFSCTAQLHPFTDDLDHGPLSR